MNHRDFRLLTAPISLAPPMLPAKRVAVLADAARAVIRTAARRITRQPVQGRPA